MDWTTTRSETNIVVAATSLRRSLHIRPRYLLSGRYVDGLRRDGLAVVLRMGAVQGDGGEGQAGPHAMQFCADMLSLVSLLVQIKRCWLVSCCYWMGGEVG